MATGCIYFTVIYMNYFTVKYNISTYVCVTRSERRRTGVPDRHL